MRKGEIDRRLDPFFYSPIFRIPDRKFFRPLKEVSKFVFHPPEYPRQFAEEGFQLIRSQNVRPVGLSLDENPVFFSEEFLRNKKVVHPRKGDVLIVRSGVNAGDVAVVEEDLDTAIVGADTLLCKCNSEILPKFLQVYFHTDLGKRQILRHITGATNRHLNAENLKRVLVPSIGLEAQQEAIKLFEEALEAKQSKESEAKNLLIGIDEYLVQRLGIEVTATGETKSIFFTRLSKLSGNRFDPEYIAYESKLTSDRYPTVPFKKLIVKPPQYGANEIGIDRIDNQAPRYIRITDIDEFGRLDVSTLGKTAERIEEKYILKDNDLLFARSGNTVGKCYLHKSSSVGFESFFAGYMIRFIVDEKYVLPEYLFNYTQTKLYKDWVSAIRRAAGQPNINASEYKSMLVPLPPIEDQTEIVEHIRKIRLQASELESNAQSYLERAKQQIEQRILGEVPTDA